jgi:hypothetical protein
MNSDQWADLWQPVATEDNRMRTSVCPVRDVWIRVDEYLGTCNAEVE